MSQEWTQPVAAIATIDGEAPHSITKYLWPTWQRIAYSEYPTRHLDYYWRLDLTQLNTGLYVLDGFMGPKADTRYFHDFRSALRAQAAWLIRQARVRLTGVDRASVIQWVMMIVQQEGVGGSTSRLSRYAAKIERERQSASRKREAQAARRRSEAIFTAPQASLFA